jgi:hypothetical protein
LVGLLVNSKRNWYVFWFSYKFSGWIANATQNAIDAPSDLAATSFDWAANATQNAIDATSDLVAGLFGGAAKATQTAIKAPSDFAAN